MSLSGALKEAGIAIRGLDGKLEAFAEKLTTEILPAVDGLRKAIHDEQDANKRQHIAVMEMLAEINGKLNSALTAASFAHSLHERLVEIERVVGIESGPGPSNGHG